MWRELLSAMPDPGRSRPEPGDKAVMVRREDVARAFGSIGFTAGSTVLVHSALSSLGTVVGGADAVIDGILDALGPDGTLAAPSLWWRPADPPMELDDWDPATSPTFVGTIAETLRRRASSCRSDHPSHAVAAFGARARELTGAHGRRDLRPGPFGERAFAGDSPWEKLHDWDALVCFVGVTYDSCTMFHYVEYVLVAQTLAALEMRRCRALAAELRGWFVSEGVWPFFDYEGMGEHLEAVGVGSRARVGSATIRHARARALVAAVLHALHSDPARWLDKPGSREFIPWMEEAEVAQAGGARAATTPRGPRGGRLLGIEVHPAEDGDTGAAARIARAAGMDFTRVRLYWDELDAGIVAFQDALARVRSLAGGWPAGICLSFDPIDTTRCRMPADLTDRRHDGPLVVRRALDMLGRVLDGLDGVRIRSLVFGNEVDVFLRQRGRWAEYVSLYREVAAWVRAKRPGLRIGVNCTYEGLTHDDSRASASELNRHSDIVFASYYPFAAGTWSVADPAVVQGDLEKLIDLYPGKLLELLEAGYPTSDANASTEEKQAEFVRQLFRVWDLHAARLAAVCFCIETDWGPETVDHFVRYYGIDESSGFRGYLGSFGFRHRSPSAGRDKLGFRAIRDEMLARGWRPPAGGGR